MPSPRSIERSPLNPVRGGSTFFVGLFLLVYRPPIDHERAALIARAVLLLIGCVLMLWPFFIDRTWSAIKQLRAALPWFEGLHVNRFASSECETIVRALEHAEYRVLEIDGREITDWPQLAAAMTNALGVNTELPVDPRQSVARLLELAVRDHPKRVAVLWRHAQLSLPENAGLLVDYTADRAAGRASKTRRVLTFLELPAAEADGVAGP